MTEKIRGVPSPLGEILLEQMRRDIAAVKGWPLWLRQNIYRTPSRNPDVSKPETRTK